MSGVAPQLYLASVSPRRRELLEQIGVMHRLLAVTVDETPNSKEQPELYVLRLALAKARSGRFHLPATEEAWVLGADTSVVIDGEMLGKPRNQAEGVAMLERLSGATHHVYTGVALVGENREVTRLSVSAVSFRSMSEEERENYWRSGEPADKAGGYAVQGRAAMFISRLEGSYSGVMGLPLFETVELLREVGLGGLVGSRG